MSRHEFEHSPSPHELAIAANVYENISKSELERASTLAEMIAWRFMCDYQSFVVVRTDNAKAFRTLPSGETVAMTPDDMDFTVVFGANKGLEKGGWGDIFGSGTEKSIKDKTNEYTIAARIGPRGQERQVDTRFGLTLPVMQALADYKRDQWTDSLGFDANENGTWLTGEQGSEYYAHAVRTAQTNTSGDWQTVALAYAGGEKPTFRPAARVPRDFEIRGVAADFRHPKKP